MKRKICTTFIIVAILAGFFGCDNGDTGPDGNGGKPIVCLGDSLTEGYGASKPNSVDKTRSYPAFLGEKVTVTVVNAGISGDTTAGGLARIGKDVLAHNPQLVIILLGANDFTHMRPANEAKKDLQSIINNIRDGNRKIYLASFIGDSSWEASYISVIPGGLTLELEAYLGEYKKMYSELKSENTDIGYIANIWKGIENSDMSDLVHPNAEGYRKMADNIFNEIKPYLQVNDLLK